MYVDEVEVDEEGIAEMLMDDNVIANVARPGTSLRKPGTAQSGPSQGVRWFKFNQILLRLRVLSQSYFLLTNWQTTLMSRIDFQTNIHIF